MSLAAAVYDGLRGMFNNFNFDLSDTFTVGLSFISNGIGATLFGAFVGMAISIRVTNHFLKKSQREADRVLLRTLVFVLVDCYDTFAKVFDHYFHARETARLAMPERLGFMFGVTALFGSQKDKFSLNPDTIDAIIRTGKALWWKEDRISEYVHAVKDVMMASNLVNDLLIRYEATKFELDVYSSEKSEGSPLLERAKITLNVDDLKKMRPTLIKGTTFVNNMISISADNLMIIDKILSDTSQLRNSRWWRRSVSPGLIVSNSGQELANRLEPALARYKAERAAEHL